MDWLQRTSALSNQLLLLAIFKESKRKKIISVIVAILFCLGMWFHIFCSRLQLLIQNILAVNSDTNGCVTEICYCHLYMSYKRFLKKIFRQLAGKEMITDSKKYPLLPLKTNDSTRVNDCLKLMIRYPTSKK